MRLSRSGFSILETTLGLVILAATIAGAAQFLILSARQQRIVDQELAGQRDLANALEQALALPYDGLTLEALQEIERTIEIASQLPDAKLSFSLVEADETPANKRLTAVLSWNGVGGDRQDTSATSWKFAQGESP